MPVTDKLNSWMTTLGARGASTQDTWQAAHYLCAAGVYRELLDSLLRDDAWTRDPVIVTAVLDGAAHHLKQIGVDRLDEAGDVLLVTDRPA